MTQVGSDKAATGARGEPGNRIPLPARSMKKLVEAVLEKLEDSGLNGIYA
jgi:hypothetical protein